VLNPSEQQERAFLVGVEFRTRGRAGHAGKTNSATITPGAQAARDHATSVAASSSSSSLPTDSPDFSSEESLDELREAAREIPWFTYVPTVSRPWDHEDWPGEIGRADDILRKYADSWGLDASNTHAYLCGHPDMIANSKAILKRRGFLDKTAIKEEIYWVPAK